MHTKWLQERPWNAPRKGLLWWPYCTGFARYQQNTLPPAPGGGRRGACRRRVIVSRVRNNPQALRIIDRPYGRQYRRNIRGFPRMEVQAVFAGRKEEEEKERGEKKKRKKEKRKRASEDLFFLGARQNRQRNPHESQHGQRHTDSYSSKDLHLIQQPSVRWNPPMFLRYCLLQGLWITHLRIVQNIPFSRLIQRCTVPVRHCRKRERSASTST